MKQFALRRGDVTPGWYAVRDASSNPKIWRALEDAGFEVIRSVGYCYVEISRQTSLKFRHIVGPRAFDLRIKDIEVNRIINTALAKNAVLRYPGSIVEGSFTDREILLLLIQQNYECNGCGTFINLKFTIDHIRPTSRGGSNHFSNIQLLCGPCNSSKCDRSMAEWVTTSDRCASRWNNGLTPTQGNMIGESGSLQDLIFNGYMESQGRNKLRTPFFGRRKIGDELLE